MSGGEGDVGKDEMIHTRMCDCLRSGLLFIYPGELDNKDSGCATMSGLN
jgi:hypothetical protein